MNEITVGIKTHSGVSIKNGQLNEFDREKLSDLMTRLGELRKTAWDCVAPTRRVQTAKLPQNLGEVPSWGVDLRVDGRTDGYLQLTPWAKSQMATVTGIPKKYFDRMDDDAQNLLVNNVQHWFGESEKSHLFRVQQGKIRAVLSDRYRPMDNFDLGWMALKTAKECPGAAFESASITDTRLYLRMLNMDRQIELTNNCNHSDTYIPGVIVSNSEVGNGSTQAVPYLFRSSCANGMILTAKKASKIHLGPKLQEGVFTPETLDATAKATFLTLRDVIKDTLTEGKLFQDFFTSISEAKEVEIKPSVFIENFGTKFSLSEEEQKCILDKLTSDKTIPADLKTTQWGVSNAITSYANDIDADKRYDFQRHGAEVMQMNKKAIDALVVA